MKVYAKSRLCDKFFNIVPGQWQGTFDDHFEIFGDKKADKTQLYLTSHPEIIKEMKAALNLTLQFIFPIRHPLDLLSTQVLRKTNSYLQLGHRVKVVKQTNYLKLILHNFQSIMATIHQWMESKWLNILPIHNDDLIKDPQSTLIKLCAFLHIKCTEEYISNCTKVIYSSPSRTRDFVYWPRDLKTSLLRTVKNYTFLEKYQYDF